MAEVELTILMPCLNEEQTVVQCIQLAQQFLEESGVCGEVLVADNGSSDHSAVLAKKAGARVINVTDRGYGKNLKYHNQYLVELANGDALLFEVQWFEENKNFKETEATEESEDTAETESVRETEETVKGTETAAESSKEVVAESASKKLSEMLDSIEIEVSVKGEEPAEALETVLESGTETQQTEETAK